MELKDATLDDLKAERGDLVIEIAKEAVSADDTATKIETLEADNKAKESKIKAMEAAQATAQIEEKRKGCKVLAEKEVKESKLPEAAKKKLLDSLKYEGITLESKDEDFTKSVKESIKGEEEYLKSLKVSSSGAPKISANGGNGTDGAKSVGQLLVAATESFTGKKSESK